MSGLPSVPPSGQSGRAWWALLCCMSSAVRGSPLHMVAAVAGAGDSEQVCWLQGRPKPFAQAPANPFQGRVTIRPQLSILGAPHTEVRRTSPCRGPRPGSGPGRDASWAHHLGHRVCPAPMRGSKTRADRTALHTVGASKWPIGPLGQGLGMCLCPWAAQTCGRRPTHGVRPVAITGASPRRVGTVGGCSSSAHIQRCLQKETETIPWRSGLSSGGHLPRCRQMTSGEGQRKDLVLLCPSLRKESRTRRG